MRTHLTFAFALFGLMVTGAFVGCAAPADPAVVDEDTAATDDAFTVSYGYRFYTVRENHDCMVRLCTGYFVKEVNNRASELHVDSITFENPALNHVAFTADGAIPAAGVVMRGYIGPPVGPWEKRALIVSDAYRGMPNVAAEHGDVLYRLRVKQEPYAVWAQPLNVPRAERLLRIDLSRAVRPNVEHWWLHDRALYHDALVAGHIHDRIATIDASQVYLHLPDAKGPCPEPKDECAGPYFAAQTRNRDRCLVFDACIPANECTLPLPRDVPKVCEEGYRQVGWVADTNHCADYACEPEFVAP